jgi:hypothetical protein
MVLTGPGQTRTGNGVPLIYDVYGLAEPTLGGEPARLAEALGITWEDRVSDYRGRYFQAQGPAGAGGQLLLQANDLRDDTGDYLQLPDYPDYRYLLFVNESQRPDEVRTLLAGLPQWRFLRRRELD